VIACLGDFTLACNGTFAGADLWALQVLHWHTSFKATPATDVPCSHSDYLLLSCVPIPAISL